MRVPETTTKRQAEPFRFTASRSKEEFTSHYRSRTSDSTRHYDRPSAFNRLSQDRNREHRVWKEKNVSYRAIKHDPRRHEYDRRPGFYYARGENRVPDANEQHFSETSQHRPTYREIQREGHSIRQEEGGSPRTHQSPSARGVPLQNLQTPIPPEALDVALGEIRDVMKQYTSCADPTESAARKERLKQEEEHGQLQESAAQLALATIATQAIDAPTVRESLSAERIPATLQLGPPQPVPDQERSPSTTKRKPGRPPGTKQTAGSPLMGIGASSRKRKTQQTKPPLARRKLNPETGTSARNSLLEETANMRVPETTTKRQAEPFRFTTSRSKEEFTSHYRSRTSDSTRHYDRPSAFNRLSQDQSREHRVWKEKNVSYRATKHDPRRHEYDRRPGSYYARGENRVPDANEQHFSETSQHRPTYREIQREGHSIRQEEGGSPRTHQSPSARGGSPTELTNTYPSGSTGCSFGRNPRCNEAIYKLCRSD
ncbi:hypothetical protein F2Q69_00038355 [Brassica cretica]|uniref:Uncharacterized protein n=1 Tax=Brassica cretica TaxID=69181 RepID=A0A8S9SK30_BRACR|nr:hypothetical protein F2Q69_00038355 [Brassica cretica]